MPINRGRIISRILIAMSTVTPVAAMAQPAATFHFEIHAGSLSAALRTFGVVTHQSLIFSDDVTAGRMAPDVMGVLSADDALNRLLASSGLRAQRTARGMLVIGSALSPVVTGAEVVPPPSSATPDGQEIVVTAQKRAEPIRQVPISISAITGADLTARHIHNFQDLSQAVPNLSFSSLGGEGLSTLQIRGISSEAGTATVAVYIDDVSLTVRNLYSEGAAEPRVFDLERVEVLRGPQGTLYGSSALGGTIKFVTVQPDLKAIHGEVSAEGAGRTGGHGDWNVRGILNLPILTDKMAIRIGIEHGVQGGYIRVDPLEPGDRAVRDSNRNDWTVARSTMVMKPTDRLSLRAAVFYQLYRSRDTDLVDLAAPGFSVTKGLREPSSDRLVVPSLSVDWDVSFADVTAVSGYYDRKFNRTNDVSASNAQGLASGNIADPAVAAAVYALKSANYLNTRVKQFSEEVRLASKPYGGIGSFPVTWLLGGFYSNEKTHLLDKQPIFGFNEAFAGFGGDPQDPGQLDGGFPNDFTNDLAYLGTRDYRTIQKAVFGELTYHIGPELRLIAGLRYVSASETYHGTGNYYYAQCDQSVGGDGCPNVTLATSHSHAVTPKFAVDWTVSRDVTLYANATKGFRLGSENGKVPLYGDPDADLSAPGTNSTRADLKALGLTSAPESYRPDSLWNYEIGTKSLLFDRRLALDLSLFYIRWNNIQQTISLTSSGYDFEVNAGNAVSYGAEAAARFTLNRHVKFEASAGYTHATLDDGVVINGVDVNNTFKGEDIAGVPRWSGTVSAEYDTTFGGAPVFARAGLQYVGKSHGSLVTTDPDYKRAGYVVADASAGVTIHGLEIGLFVKNLANNNRVIQRPNILNAGNALAYRLAPRTIGGNVRMAF
jgi:iron complex outermembrane recepter protein